MTGRDLADGSKIGHGEISGDLRSTREDEETDRIVIEAAKELEDACQMLDTHPFAGPVTSDWTNYQLPEGYGWTRVVLLVRDPYCLHCYWEISDQARDDFFARLGIDLRHLQHMLRIYDLTSGAGDRSKAYYFDVPVGQANRSWYLNTNRPGHKFQVELGVDVPGRGFTGIALSNEATAPTDQISTVFDEEWMVVEEDFMRLYQMAAGIGFGSSEELAGGVVTRWSRQMGSGAVSSLGSGFRLPEEKRHFWLVVGTELIVYGATQPGAAVTVDGRAAEVREDGSFSLRMALPDGERSIPVSSSSPDGKENITITPWVRKETH